MGFLSAMLTTCCGAAQRCLNRISLNPSEVLSHLERCTAKRSDTLVLTLNNMTTIPFPYHKPSSPTQSRKSASPEILTKQTPVKEDIRSELRTVIGQLNWLACISKSEISFEVSYLSSRVTEATIEDVIKANKIVTRIQANTSRLLFSSLDRRFLRIQVLSDGSFNSLPTSGSQGGQIVLLYDN